MNRLSISRIQKRTNTLASMDDQNVPEFYSENSRSSLELALSSSRLQSIWNPEDHVEKLVLRLREMDLSSVRVLVHRTDDIVAVAYANAMEGRVISLAALLIVAPEKVMVPLMVEGPDGLKKNNTIYQCLIREVESLIQKGGDCSSELGGKRTSRDDQKKLLLMREVQLIQFLESSIRMKPKVKEGTTIVFIVCDRGILLAADGRRSRDERPVNDKIHKLSKIGTTMACATGGTVPHAANLRDALIRYVTPLEKLVEREVENLKSGKKELVKCVERGITVREAAKVAFKIRQKSYIPSDEVMVLVLAGYDWGPDGKTQVPTVALVTEDFYHVYELEHKFEAFSGNKNATSSCMAVLRKRYKEAKLRRVGGYVTMADATYIARKAILEASRHDKFTGGLMTVCHIQPDFGQQRRLRFKLHGGSTIEEMKKVLKKK